MMRSIARRIVPTCIGVTCLACLSLAATMARSETNETRRPLAMTFVDATPQTSGPIYDELQGIVQSSEGLDHIPPSDFLFDAERFRVGLDVLADDEARRERRQLIKRAMIAHRLEAIVVYKQHDDAFHLIVLGPNARELEHFEAPIRRSTMTNRQALGVLEKLFDVLIPEVRTYRKKREQLDSSRQTIDDQPLPPPPDEPSGDAPSDRSSTTSSSGETTPGVTFSASPMFGHRQLDVSTQNDFRLQHATPFYGARADVGGRFVRLGSERRAGLGAAGFFEGGFFKTSFPNEDSVYPGRLLRGGLDLRYWHDVGATWRLYGSAGFEGMGLAIDPNFTYVGSEYLATRIGAGATVRFERLATLELTAHALPMLAANTDDGAFGASATTVGFDGSARFVLRPLNPLRLALFYDVSWYPVRHPTPRDYRTPASGRDLINVLGLSIGYVI